MRVDFPELASAIFSALRRRGFSDGDIANAIGATPARYKSLATGIHQLTNREMCLLEDLSDRTIGQLGMEGFEIHDPSLRKVMNTGAALRDVLKGKPSPGRKRPA